MAELLLFHGSRQVVEKPEIRCPRYHKDFGSGFYCTILKEQAVRRAMRYAGAGYANQFLYRENCGVRIKRFEVMTEEWLDLIALCRSGGGHDFDIVEGPMANDTIFNYVQDFADGKISREAFRALARFRKPTHQICFHTPEALTTLTFAGFEKYENQ